MLRANAYTASTLSGFLASIVPLVDRVLTIPLDEVDGLPEVLLDVYVYDSERVQPSGPVGELVLPAQASSDVDQFARTPYAAGFVRDSTEFILTTVHVLWGEKPADRIGELTAFAGWMRGWADRPDDWNRNLLVLGDFNLDRIDDPLFDAEGRVEYDEKNDEVGYERLVAESMRSPAGPFGKKLETVWIGGYWDGRRAVQLTEHFPDHVQARPVPVSQRVSQYDSAVKTFLKSKDWQFVSAEHLTRAGHVLQAIAVEAKRRGYRVLSTGSARGRGQSGWSPRKARLVVEIRGQEYGTDLREKPRPGAAKLPPRNSASRRS